MLPDLSRRCQCGHPSGDHSAFPPYACLTLAVPPDNTGGPGCPCPGWEEER